MEIIKAFNLPVFGVKPVTLDEIIANIGDYQIANLCLDPDLIINNEKLIKYTDKEHPITVGDSFGFGKFLGFDKEYFLANKEEILHKVAIILGKINIFNIQLKNEFITDEILLAVSQNENIKVISLGTKNNPFTLTTQVYELFKNTGKESVDTDDIAPELEKNYDPIIGFNVNKKLILSYNYQNLIKEDELIIDRPLKDEEIDNLVYIKEGCKLKFKEFSDYNNIFRIINKCKELNKKSLYTIIVQSENNYDYKNIFNEFIFKNADLIDNDISIGVGIFEKYSMKDYIKYEEQLIKLIQPAFNLSPLEKYLYAYNVTKKFKVYKENEDNADLSRHLYEILSGDYMVCVGYATMAIDLLNKLGVSASRVSVSVDVGYDGVDKDIIVAPDDVLTKGAGHARLQVNLVDPKYNIDGYYLADPTWDNVMGNDAYNYALMTQDEYNGIHRYNFMDKKAVDELFFVHSLEEFYEKVNVLLDNKERPKDDYNLRAYKEKVGLFKESFKEFMQVLKHVDKKNYDWYDSTYKNLYSMNSLASNTKRFMTRIENVIKANNSIELKEKFEKLKSHYNSAKYNLESYRQGIDSQKKKVLIDLIDYFKNVDPVKYKEFNEKYQYLREYKYQVSEEELKNILLDLGEYIVSKTNKTISGETIFSAIREVYARTSGLSDEELDSKMSEIIEFNKTRQEKCFPIRYKILQDGTKVPILNETNKFDIEEKCLSI